jgi:hypothetical protein
LLNWQLKKLAAEGRPAYSYLAPAAAPLLLSAGGHSKLQGGDQGSEAPPTKKKTFSGVAGPRTVKNALKTAGAAAGNDAASSALFALSEEEQCLLVKVRRKSGIAAALHSTPRHARPDVHNEYGARRGAVLSQLCQSHDWIVARVSRNLKRLSKTRPPPFIFFFFSSSSFKSLASDDSSWDAALAALAADRSLAPLARDLADLCTRVCRPPAVTEAPTNSAPLVASMPLSMPLSMMPLDVVEAFVDLSRFSPFALAQLDADEAHPEEAPVVSVDALLDEPPPSLKLVFAVRSVDNLGLDSLHALADLDMEQLYTASGVAAAIAATSSSSSSPSTTSSHQTTSSAATQTKSDDHRAAAAASKFTVGTFTGAAPVAPAPVIGGDRDAPFVAAAVAAVACAASDPTGSVVAAVAAPAAASELKRKHAEPIVVLEYLETERAKEGAAAKQGVFSVPSPPGSAWSDAEWKTFYALHWEEQQRIQKEAWVHYERLATEYLLDMQAQSAVLGYLPPLY